MKKRVLQLIGSFHQGGSERQAIAISRLLKEDATYDVYAATLNKQGSLLTEMEAIGLPEIPEFALTSFFNPNFFHQVRAFSRYLRVNKIDLVHTHDFYTNVFGMVAAEVAGITAKVASKRETGAMRSRGQDIVERFAFRRADAIVVNSIAVRTHLTSRRISESKTSLIYNGLDLDRFTGNSVTNDFLIENRLTPNSQAKFITLVANLRHHVKNIPMLLRAAQRVFVSRPETHFVVAGEGELESELRDLAELLGVAGNVHFIGRCMDIPGLLAASYACVLTSTAEGFSNSIIEYMAAGKPVVATDVGGAAEAIADGRSGYLVASDDDEGLARYLVDLLDDESKANAFGYEGRRIATANYSQEAQLRNTVALYKSLLS